MPPGHKKPPKKCVCAVDPPTPTPTRLAHAAPPSVARCVAPVTPRSPPSCRQARAARNQCPPGVRSRSRRRWLGTRRGRTACPRGQARRGLRPAGPASQSATWHGRTHAHVRACETKRSSVWSGSRVAAWPRAKGSVNARHHTSRADASDDTPWRRRRRRRRKQQRLCGCVIVCV